MEAKTVLKVGGALAAAAAVIFGARKVFASSAPEGAPAMPGPTMPDTPTGGPNLAAGDAIRAAALRVQTQIANSPKATAAQKTRSREQFDVIDRSRAAAAAGTVTEASYRTVAETGRGRLVAMADAINRAVAPRGVTAAPISTSTPVQTKTPQEAMRLFGLGADNTVPTAPRRYLSRPFVASVHRWEGVFGGEPALMLPYGAAPRGPYVGASTGMSTRVPRRSMTPTVPKGGAQHAIPVRPAVKVAPVATNARAIAPFGAPVVRLGTPRRVA